MIRPTSLTLCLWRFCWWRLFRLSFSFFCIADMQIWYTLNKSATGQAGLCSNKKNKNLLMFVSLFMSLGTTRSFPFTVARAISSAMYKYKHNCYMRKACHSIRSSKNLWIKRSALHTKNACSFFYIILDTATKNSQLYQNILTLIIYLINIVNFIYCMKKKYFM